MRLIIHHPEKQTNQQRWALGIITAGFWMFWFYLWLPFVSLLAWLFGYRLFEYQMIELGGYKGLLDLLGTYSVIIVLLGSTLIGWAVYNIRRFGGKADRRKGMPPVTVDLHARHFNVDVEQLKEWRKSQRLVISHGSNSEIVDVSVTKS
ncbi:MAG TPA: poly-beta-1,6-N-acetyl-D-glucosamine biosynthesis protein PgaD [Gallionella sp.]|nr:poly-beta-1,6-N-acetyl-D-glucosamine biosynthesis protein PgaD [Gallionella sp.]